jgi:hypothetical protein
MERTDPSSVRLTGAVAPVHVRNLGKIVRLALTKGERWDTEGWVPRRLQSARGGGCAGALRDLSVVRIAVNHNYVGLQHPVPGG